MTREIKRTVQDSRRDLRMLKHFDSCLFRSFVASEQATMTRESLRELAAKAAR